jgi:hypothetical protein
MKYSGVTAKPEIGYFRVTVEIAFLLRRDLKLNYQTKIILSFGLFLGDTKG